MSQKQPATTKPPPKPTTPFSSELPRTLLIVVVALIIVVVVFGIVPFLQNAFNPTPNVVIGNKVPSSSGCGSAGQQYYTYSWTFTLTNTGNTDVNATIGVVNMNPAYTGNGPLLYTQAFKVPKGAIIYESISYDAITQGCTHLSLDIAVQKITSA